MLTELREVLIDFKLLFSKIFIEREPDHPGTFPIAREEDAQTAFNDAICLKVLSSDPNASNYAGNYMYMCTDRGRHQFKHHDTRCYVTCKAKK